MLWLKNVHTCVKIDEWFWISKRYIVKGGRLVERTPPPFREKSIVKFHVECSDCKQTFEFTEDDKPDWLESYLRQLFRRTPNRFR